MEKIEVITKKNIEPLEEKAIAISQEANLEITSQEKLKQANEVLGRLKIIKKAIKEKKDSIVGPITIALKNTKELFRPMEEKVNMAETSIKNGILDYKKRIDRIIESQKKQVAEKIVKGETTFEDADKKIEKIEEKTTEFKTRKIREIEIVDKTKIPKKYWVIDMVNLRKDALGGKKIPGIKIVEREIAIM